MVSTASAAAQANELEKKRKQTLERAKANHLSRQLQMRLQYARLKVEHGWQRQNLNEVENLYFHHSHQRGPRTFASSALAINQNEPLSLLSSRYSDPSYKSWLNSQSRSSFADALGGSSNQETSSLPSDVATVPSTPAITSLQFPLDPSGTLRTSSTPPVSTETHDPQTPHDPITAGQTPVPGSQEGAMTDRTASGESHPTPNSLNSSAATLPPEGASSISKLTKGTNQSLINGSSSYIPNLLTPNPMSLSKRPPAGQKTNPSSSTSKDLYSSGSSSLTYDSFWSGLQSKSYPALRASGTPAATGTTTGASGNITGSLSSSQPNPPYQFISPNPAAPPSLVSSVTSPPQPPTPSTSLQQTFGQPLPLATSTATSSPMPATIPAPSLPPTIPTPTTLLPTPKTPPPPVISPPPSQEQIAMSPNRYLAENFLPWAFAPAQFPGGQVPTAFSPGLFPASLLTNPAAYPFLANLSASYAQAFGGQSIQSPPPVVGEPLPDGSHMLRRLVDNQSNHRLP